MSTDDVDIDEILKALANPVRREILIWLKEPRKSFPNQAHSHDFGVCAGQIDQKAGLAQPTISGHLSVLQRAGLLTCQKVGQWSYFRRNETVIQRFVETLDKQL